LFERYHQQHQGGNVTQGFRYFNVYGPGETHKGSQASPHTQFAKQACETGCVKVFENSDQYIRDFVPVEQVVATHLAFLNSQESGVFNIGTGKPKSFLQVAQQFDVPVIEIPMPEQLKASYQKYTCADMTKTNRVYDHFKTTNPH
jgi:ADP-L-glycero-D-manno-heptose 6-epimerase